MGLRHTRIPLHLEFSDGRRALRLAADVAPRQALLIGAGVVMVAGGARLLRALGDLIPAVSLEDLDLLEAEV